MRILKKTLFAGLAALAFILFAAVLWMFRTLADLPDVMMLKRYRPPAASEVLDRNGAVLLHLSEGKFRVWAPIADLPDHVIQAVVTAEDDTFFGHEGINYTAVWEALKHDVEKKRFARGGSTITQQMIKNVLLSREKTIARKLREFVLARRAEEVLTKRQILEIYLNEVEWGRDLHGIEAAARFYFDKHARELTDAEAALLAGMLPNPKYYDPFKRPDKARQRQERVLFNMQQAKLLTQEAYQQALAEPLRLRGSSPPRFDLPPVGEGQVRLCSQRAFAAVLGSFYSQQELYRGGLRIRTTMDRPVQLGLAGTVPASGETADPSNSIVVVLEGTEIRAIVCSADEERTRAYLNSFDPPLTAFEVLTVPVDAVSREQILAQEPRTTPSATAGATAPQERVP